MRDGRDADDVELSLGELAYRRLRDLVLTGELQPGERVTERGLQTSLGLSASPVRDALARLDVEGLIVTLPRRGYRVSPLSIQSIEDVFDVWHIIGPALVAIASRRLGKTGMQELHSQILSDSCATDTPAEASRKAWTAISLATSNPHLIDTFARLELHLARILHLTIDFIDKIPNPGHGHHFSVLETLLLDDEGSMKEDVEHAITEFRQEVLTAVRQLSSVTSAELTFRAS